MAAERRGNSPRLLWLLLLLALSGCSHRATQTPPRVTLAADPNPVPAGSGRGSTTLTWNIADGTQGEIYVSINGAKEELFAGLASRGSQKADWIDAGSTYEFRLYEGKAHEKVLGSVTVTRTDAQGVDMKTTGANP